ncbi:hypothetical protein PIB30_034036 [Stylosanthes scabra]|uniref:Uncharacterized protein n=1 Tax=Stylosanthes scabra TaxID=79078 RepID=A0ABU6XCC7_9FABA|nr:hypothetical protein [Stylosanthes scabra]
MSTRELTRPLGWDAFVVVVESTLSLAGCVGNYKEKKLRAKHNLKKEEELMNQGNFKAGYRYPATWYRYPRRKPTPNHVQAWIRRDPRPNPR